MSKDLCNESTKAIRLRNVQSIFGYFAEQRMNKERWETEPANLAAYTAVDKLDSFARRIEEIYGTKGETPNSKYYAEYMSAINFFRAMKELNKES